MALLLELVDWQLWRESEAGVLIAHPHNR